MNDRTWLATALLAVAVIMLPVVMTRQKGTVCFALAGALLCVVAFVVLNA